MVLPPPMQSSLPAGWLAFTGRASNPLDHNKRFQITHPPFLDLSWRYRDELPPSHSTPPKRLRRQPTLGVVPGELGRRPCRHIGGGCPKVAACPQLAKADTPHHP